MDGAPEPQAGIVSEQSVLAVGGPSLPGPKPEARGEHVGLG